MASTTYVADPYNFVEIQIVRDADWRDSLPQFFDDGVALDCTGQVLELYIRPTYDHSTLIKKLSTETGELVWVDESLGKSAIEMPRADVIADIPVGEWDIFAVLSADSPDTYREPFRGKLIVHAGNIAE